MLVISNIQAKEKLLNEAYQDQNGGPATLSVRDASILLLSVTYRKMRR